MLIAFGLRRLLPIIIILFFGCSVLRGNDLFWIGGSGNFNDPQHWSATSGGYSAGVVPTINDNVFFDASSADGIETKIFFNTNASCRDFTILDNYFPFEFSNAPGVTLKISGSFITSTVTKFVFTGKLEFNSSLMDNVIRMHGTQLDCEVTFNGAGSWKPDFLFGRNGLKLVQNDGTIIINNGGVKCREFISNGGELKLNNGLIRAYDYFEIKSQTILDVTRGWIQAPTTVASNYKVPANLPSQNLKVNNVAMACDFADNIVATFTTCSNNCSGLAAISFTGCTNGPYTAEWYDGFGNPLPLVVSNITTSPYNEDSLCCSSLSYAVVFYDNTMNSVDISQVSVTCPTPPIVIKQLVNTKCNDTCDGKSMIQISGSYPGFCVNYTGPVANVPSGYPHCGVLNRDTAYFLCAGTYTLTVTNSIGCVTTQTFTINEPAPISPNDTIINVDCFGSSTGSITLNPTGGNGGYSYVWNPPSGQTGNTVSGLPVGTYSASITDSKGCPGSYTGTITQPPNITFAFSQVNPLCGDVCNGTATVNTVVGGVPPYSFSWAPLGTASSSGADNSTATGLCPGQSYTVTITDANNCVKTSVFNITAPSIVVATNTVTNVSCPGGSDGSSLGSATGGVNGFTYCWFNSSSTSLGCNNPVTGLSSGTYSLVAIDANGCDDTITFTVTEPPPITSTVTSNYATCSGICNGDITTSVSGGTPGYSFSWNPLLSGQNPTNVCAGSYTVTITDANGCQSSNSVSVTEPPPITFSLNITNPTCNGLSNGTANVTASGGTGTITAVWADCASCTFPRTGMTAGTYTVVAVDGVACQDTFVFTLTEPNQLNVSVTATPLTCSNSNDGTISSTVSGGTPSYSYSWNGIPGGPTYSGATAGNYTLAVTDANGCVVTASVTVTAPNALDVTVTSTDPPCFGQCTGTASGTAVGGTQPYTFLWSNGFNTTNLVNLCSGSFTLTVTDANGCTDTDTADIVTPTPLSVSVTPTNITCSGSCNGSATATITGGTPGYSANWSNGGTGTTISGLCPNNYNVTITDANGCMSSANTTITQPLALSVSVFNIMNSCISTCTGSADALASGGTPGYTYNWSSGATGTSATGLCGGSGTVTATDANGCTSSATFSVAATFSVTITTTSNTLDCFGDCNGIATGNVSGATGSVTYSWASPVPTNPSSQSTPTAVNLCAGTHTLTVTDGGGCVSTSTVTFVDPTPLTSTVVVTNETCFNQCNGGLSLTVNGGTGANTVFWNPGGQSTYTLNSLCSGVYTYTVTDSKGCELIDSASVGAANLISATFTATDPTTCSSADGCITANPAGGTAPYTFTWNPPVGQSTQTVCGLTDGVYSVSISDVYGCSVSIQAALNDPNGPTATVASNDVSCFGFCDGSATITASGTGAVTVTWPNPPGTVGPTATNLCADTFLVTLSDVTGCNTYTSVIITQPASMTQSPVITNVTCNAGCNGSINPAIAGGTPPYAYTWTAPASGSPATGLCAGTYTVGIVDQNGCTASFGPYTITEPPPIVLTASSTDISCFGLCTGSASASASGGTGAIAITWVGPNGYSAATPSIINLCAGTYTVTGTDVNGCVATETVTIVEPTLFDATISTTSVTCNGVCNGTAVISTTGGTGTPTYSWTPANGNNGTVSNLCAGSYTATATDANGCFDTLHFTISQPAVLAVSINSTPPECFGACTGTADVTASGGTAGYTYSWSPIVAITSTVTNVCSGTHTVTVTDANGCNVIGTVNILDPTPVQGNYSATPVTCGNPCSATISVVPSGGSSGTYTTSISPGTSFTNLCPDTYTVTITDGFGCTNSNVMTISLPPGLTIASSVSPSNCTLPCVGSIVVTPTTGTAPYDYIWFTGNPADTSASINGLCAGIYTVQVTDASNCIDTFSVSVSDANAADSVDISVTNPTCSGICDGTAVINQVFNGTAPFQYEWSTGPNDTLSSISGLCIGNYFVTIVDANNCTFIPALNVLQPLPIVATSSVTQATCNGLCNGAVNVNVSGGTGGYTYSWTGSNGFTSTSLNISNLCAGTYSLVITDANLCSTTLTVSISNNVTINGTTTSTNISCNGACNGTALINSISGGTAPYTIAWNDPLGQSVINPSGLCTGTYDVTVTDAIGCVGVFTTPAITEPGAMQATSTTTDATCGVCDGQASVSVSGGTGAFSYQWSSGQTTAAVTNLCGGVYMVDITDAAGCVIQYSVGVSNTNAPSITVSPTNISCDTACSGAAAVSVSGGLAPYTINWVPGGQNGPSISGLCAGTYFVQALDANNCISTQSFTITATTALSLTQSSVQPFCGACNGVLGVTASGGTAPFTYNWSNGSSNNTITGICAGVYTVTVTDSSGCTGQEIFALSNSGAPLLSINVDAVDCNGSSNGEAFVTITGGTSPYNISWNGVAGTATITSLSAGTNVVSVTDAAGCVATSTFNVSEPSPLALSLNATVLPNCGAVCNGSITAIPSGGSLPYTFMWSTGDTTTTISNLCAGSYSVVVMDANNCNASQNTILNNNPNLISGNATVVDPSCGACNGSIALSPSGGVAPYTYNWTTGANTPSITNVCAGVYQVVIADSFGCQTPVFVNISNSGGPTVNVSSTAETCFGLCDGTATAIADTGSGPYQYFWVSGGQMTDSIGGLCPGTYTVQVLDVNNCVTTTPVIIPSALPIQANAVISTPTCGASNGAITISPTGGSGSGYTFSWSGGLGNSNTITNISAGIYTVTITDGSGCAQQIVIPVSNGTIPLVAVATDSVLCNGNATGTATVTISGGSGAYTINWSTGASTLNVSSLAAGSYWVSVVDNTTSCSTSVLFDIDEPDTLALSLNSQQQPTCGLANNGALTAIPNGGTLPYSYLWQPGNLPTPTISNLSAGSFTVQVTDANGCTRSQTTVLNNASSIATLNPSVTGPTCNQCDGSITLNPTGGNLPLTFAWSNGSTSQNVTNICAGVYQVLVTDSIGCQQTFSVPISNINGITSDVQTITNESCFNTCDGAATVTPVGGTAPYSFNWVGLQDTTNNISNICAGSYFLQTTDANGCIFTSQVDITSPAQLFVTPIVASPNCNASTGGISLQVSGGASPYTYNWQPLVSTASSVSNIPAGNYQVTISDAAGCSQNFVFSISSVGAPTISAAQTNVSCADLCDGAINLSFAGGTAPFTYAWSNGATTSSVTGLCDTTINVVVTDANGCIAAANYSVTEPDPIQFSLSILNTPLCFGDSNGVMNIIPSGGTLGYSFSWNPPIAGNVTSATNLLPGVYAVTVTDASGCTATQTDTLTQPPLLTLAGVVTPASCSTVPDASIDLTVTGGTPGYDFNWTSGDSIEDLINILAGNYTVVVTDTNACSDSLSFVVNASVVVNAVIGNDTTICYSPTFLLDASATTGAASITWYDNSGNTVASSDTVTVPIITGTNTFIVIAVNGACADTDTIVITNNALPQVNAGPDQTILMFNSVQIGGSPTGSAGSTFSWTPGSFLSDSISSNPVASPTVTTSYIVTVTNTSGCSASDTVVVRVLPLIIFPNGFTPNGDGKNDTWIIDNIQLFPECEVEVYNRWGEQLFYSKGYTTPWDGTYKGKGLPVGTYYYAIKLNHELFPDPYTGPITILR